MNWFAAERLAGMKRREAEAAARQRMQSQFSGASAIKGGDRLKKAVWLLVILVALMAVPGVVGARGAVTPASGGESGGIKPW